MGDWGIAVSKPGKSVYSTEPKDFVLNSKYTVVKIAQEGMGTISVPAGGAYGTITHNLGFVPLIVLYTELTPNSNRWYFSTPLAPEENTSIDDEIVGTGAGIFHLKNNTGSTKTIRYRYFVLGDSA